jgi:dihydroxyacetone kinase
VEVVHAKIGELLTVQEMSGFQMILAKLDADHVDARALVLDDLFFESLIIMDSDE